MSDRSAKARALALLAPTWLILGSFFLLPMAIMLVISFGQRDRFGNVRPVGNVPAYLRSLKFLSNYRDSLDPLLLSVQWRSLWLALVTTSLCLLVGYPVAYFIAVVARHRKNFWLALVVIPFWTSFLIRTYAWMLILRSQGLLNLALMRLHLIHEPLELLDTQWAVLIGLVYGELPFMILPIYASLEKLDRALLEAAADLGARPMAAFFRVTLPVTMPGVVAGTVLVFIPSLGQFIVSDLLGGAKSQLIGNVIYDQFLRQARNPPFGSALAFELTAAVLAMLFAYALYARKRGQEELL